MEIPLWYETSTGCCALATVIWADIDDSNKDGHTFMLDKEPGPSSGYFSSRNSMTSTRPALVCVLTKIGRES